MQWALSCGRAVTRTIFEKPLFYVYMHGPRYLGGWKSRAEADICSAMTNVDASFWHINAGECSDMILKDFQSVYAVLMILLYVYFLVQVVQGLFYRYVVFAPVHENLRTVKKLLLTLHPGMAAIEAG